MEFRWLALIALWTLVAGPIFNLSSGSNPLRLQLQTAKTANR
jgi:hypothetical protein